MLIEPECLSRAGNTRGLDFSGKQVVLLINRSDASEFVSRPFALLTILSWDR